jgi:hypothetical protein
VSNSVLMIAMSFAVARAESPKQIEPLRRATVTVRLDHGIGPISPYIYGTNDDKPQAWTAAKRHTFGRLGGNRWTAYNWETNASNAGKDWHHQNDGYLSQSDEPAKAVTDRLDVIQKHGVPALVTVPIQGWVAADKSADGDVAKAGEDFLQKRFFANVDVSWKKPSLLPDKTDRVVFQSEFVRFLEDRRKQRGPSAPPIWYSLDNEPDLWHETHPRIQPHPIRARDLIQRSIEFARAIKDAAPDALVFGPAASGWNGMFRSEANRAFLEHYVAAFAKERTRTGKRLLDVLDVHWYPEHRSDTNVRVIEDDESDAVAAARMLAPRSLADPRFVERSWIARDVYRRPINLLERLKKIVSDHDPGLKLAVTEYYYGGGAHPSGAVAQADVLGILGREGVFAANSFHMGRTDDRYIHAAFDLYRNYDGQGNGYGDLAVDAFSDREFVGVHAAVHTTPSAPNVATIVLLNRSLGPTSVNLSFVRPRPNEKGATRFQVAAPTPKPVKVETGDLSDLLLPPMSATLIVVPR